MRGVTTKIDGYAIVPFPDDKVWAEYYSKFRNVLVNSLNHGYCLADREDAVEEAFDKLMHRKDRLAWGLNFPQTEKDWIKNLWWQARASLSHMKERCVRHAKYVEFAAKELEDVFAPVSQGVAMDNESLRQSIVRALVAFRRDQDVSRRDLAVYLGHVRGIPAAKLAKKFCINANNVDQIKYRVGILLRRHGLRCFARVRGAA